MRYVLVGNYGVGNFGDEALREYFLRTFPEGEWTALSARPRTGELHRLPAGLRSLLLTPWWRTLRALRASDGVVFGGGTLFTDVESIKACLLWWWHALICWMLRKPFFLAFQGIGPFRTPVGEWCARWAVRHARFVSVRDSASFTRLEHWKKNTNIVQTCDPVFSLLKANEKQNGSQKLLVIIPRKNSSDSFIQRAISLRKEGGWGEVRILSLQPEDPAEHSLCSKLAECTGGRVIPVRATDDLTREMSAASLVLTQRYHGAVGALALGVPFEVVPQWEGDKLAELSLLSSSVLLSLLSEGERCFRAALFQKGSGSGRIQL